MIIIVLSKKKDKRTQGGANPEGVLTVARKILASLITRLNTRAYCNNNYLIIFKIDQDSELKSLEMSGRLTSFFVSWAFIIEVPLSSLQCTHPLPSFKRSHVNSSPLTVTCSLTKTLSPRSNIEVASAENEGPFRTFTPESIATSNLHP
jgi:hypothetical protein